MSAVKEEVLEELEVLRAIYDHDFEERPSTWQNVPSFAIRVMPTQNSVHHHNTECFVIVKFTLPVAYPKIAPKVEIEKSAGLSQKESLELSKAIEEQIKANLNSVMCHEVIVGIRSFLETLGNYVPESFYDAMIRKEKEKDNMLRNLKDAAEDSDTKESSLQQKSHALSPVKRPFSKENSMMSHVNTTKILEEIDKLQVEDQSLNHLSTSKIVMDNKKKTLSIPNPTPSRSFRAKNKKSVFDELEDIEEESDEFDSDDKQPSNSKAPVFDYSKSRYAQEFEPMQLLGNGASGEVWKVKHKLDQKIYAVKKINLNYKNNSLRHKIQREVTTISSLFHKNIVRYYAAWIEQYEEILPVESGDNPKSSSKTASTSNMGKEKFISNTESKGNSSNAWLTGNPFAKEAEKELDRNNFALNDYSIMFSEGNDGSSGKDINLGVSSGFGFKPTRYSHIYNYGNSSSSDDSSSSSEEESSDSSESSVSEKSKEESQGERKRNSDWLFIQMEYCYTTLRAFIDETELWKRPVEVKRLFREMLEALAYVHDRKVIHRDLKPANVFLDGEGNIKLGDFGLATRRKKDSRQPKSPSKGLLSHHDFNTSSDYIDHSSHGNHPQIISVTNEAATVDDSLTIGIGTALYRAPEQEMVHSGSHNAAFSVPYNQKADMYSLGIILFEMCHPKFDTQMERFTTLKRLRESQLFPDLFNDSNFPSKELVKIIKWLTNQDPKDRPSATELLSSDLFPSKFDAIDSKYIEELNEAINRPNSLVSLKVLLTLFNKMKFLKEYESSSQFLKEILFNNLSFYIRSFQKDQKLMSYRLLKENVSTFVNKRAQGNAAASLSSTRDHGQSLIVNSLLYLNCLKKHLREIFEIHGGVEYSNQYLELKTSASEYVYYNPYLKKASSSSGYPICEYLDKNGQTLLLPNNLVTPFARIAAFLNLTVAQRFAFEKIYYSSSSTNEKSVATLLNFGNNIQSSQPEVLNEAIYDVIVPANSSIHAIMAEYEILSCTRAFLKRYRQLIPSYFVRLGHSLLTDALMGIICLDIHVNKLRGGNTPGNPNSATPNNQQQTKHEHNASNLAGEREKTGTTTNLDDISAKIRKVLSLCNEIQNEKELHDLVFDQKLPAYQASKVTTFCRSYIRQARVSRENPLFLLSCIEKAFYDSIDVQEISKSQEKEVQEVKPAAPAILNAPVKKIDISEIRLDQIGVKRNVKPNKKQQEDKATKVNEKPPTINPVKAEDKSQKNTNIYEEEVKKYAKMFHRGLKHLQILLEMIISSSNADDQNFLSSVVLDMGIESINLPRNINIFHGQGLIFLVEVVANGSFPSTLTNEGNDESREQDDEPSTNLSKLNEDSSVLKRKLMMQRRKGATVIVSGGHYEQIISEYKEQYNAFESWSDSISVFACASVFYLHNILSVLQKSETRKTFATILPSKDSGKSQSIDSYFLTHSQHLQPMRLQALVVSSQQYTSSLSTNTVSGTSQARTTSLSPMNVPNLKASSAPAAANSTLLKQGHHQASNQIDNSPGFNYGLTYKPYFLTSVIKVLEILRGHGISASGYLSQLHGYNLSSSNILDFCKRLSIPHLVIVDENNERNTEEITVHSLSVNESTKELTFVENSIHISKLAEYVLSFSANPSGDKRSIGIHSDLLKPLPANQSGNKKNLTKDGNSSTNSSNPSTNNAATLKEGLTAKAIQAINQESDKRLFLFYPIINFESHEYGYLQASSSVSNKDNREFNHSFNSKKKRKDIDQLFMNLIVQISFLTSDIFPSSGSAMLPGNSSNGPASSTNNKTSNEGNSSVGNSIGKPSGSSSANSNNNPQGLAGNHQSPSSSVSSPNLTQLLQQYQIKLIYELSNNQLLFSNQHFFYDRIRNLKIFKLIIGLEMNFAIIRAINTLLMNPKILNNFSLLKNELNNNHFFNLYDVTSNSRKLVKNYLLSLIALSNQIISFQNQSSSSSSFSSSSGNTNNLQGNMGSSQANISSNSSSSSSGNSNRTGKYVLYLYSLPDDSIDSLHFTPETLIPLKSVV